MFLVTQTNVYESQSAQMCYVLGYMHFCKICVLNYQQLTIFVKKLSIFVKICQALVNSGQCILHRCPSSWFFDLPDPSARC